MAKLAIRRNYEFEGFRLDPASLMLYRNGVEVSLPPKAIETLLALVERSGKIVSTDELMKIIWTDSIVEESNLSQYLHLLRKTLGKTCTGKPFIETLKRRGYRFNGQVAVSAGPNGNLSRTKELADDNGDHISQGVSASTNRNLRPLRVEQSDNIYSVVEWQRENPTQSFAAEVVRRPTTWSIPLIVLAFVIASVGLAIGMYKFAGGGKPTAANAVAIPFQGTNMVRLTTAGRTKRAAISPDGRYVAYVTEDPEGSNLWVRQVTGTADVRIAGPSESEYVWAAFAPDGNSVYYLSLDRDKGDTELYRVPALGGPVVKAAHDTGPVGFSPDGASMVFIRMYQDESRVIVSGTDGSNERVLATRRQPEYFRENWNAPAWSPDGKTIACPARLADELGYYETIIAFNAEDGSERRLTSGRWQQVGQPQWLADGLLLTAAERSTGPQQVWHISPDGSATRVTHDLNDYYGLSLTADGTRLAAVQSQVVSSFWVTRDGSADNSKQIASEVGRLDDLAWMRNTRIAYLSNGGGGSDIWIIDGDGANARQLTTGVLASRGLAVSPDGNQIVFSSERSGRSNIWRVNADGTNLTQLTNVDGEFYPQCTPDGQWIVFQRGEVETTLWKISVNGGEAIQISSTIARRPAISPDGSLVAFHYLDSQMDKSRWGIGIVPIDGGTRLKRFDFPPTVKQRFVGWSPDGSSIAFPNTLNGGSDIWLQPLDGKRQRQLTGFKAENILAFDWSPDGHSFAVIRSVETSDIVLMNNPEP